LGEKLLRLCLFGSAICLLVFILGSIAMWGLNVIIILGLVGGTLIGVLKTQFSAVVLFGLIKNNSSSKKITVLNLMLYMLSWGIIIFMFILANNFSTSLLFALVAGISVVPLVFMIYGILRGAGLVKYEI